MTLEAGPELDAAVAKACGITFAQQPLEVMGFPAVMMFSPSQKLDDAFKAAEKCGLWERHYLGLNRFFPSTWCVYETIGAFEEMNIVSEATTPALAICSAILSLKGSA